MSPVEKEPMMNVLRWGRSAYETEASLALEAEKIRLLGGSWRHAPDAQLPQDAQANVLVINSGVRVTAEVLTQTRCQLVLATTSGVDHVDLAACRAAKVVVARCPLARRDAVVEHALAAMVWLRRRLTPLQEAAQVGRWARAELPQLKPNGIHGATIAVIGLGVIGQQMATILQLMGAKVLGVDPAVQAEHIENLPLDEALTRADIVTLHCGLNDTNHQLLSRKRLSALKEHVIVVNTARGALLDVEFAAQMVHNHQLAAIAVDVFPEEPYPSLKQLSHPQVLLTPHASGYTDDLARRVSEEVYTNLKCWLEGSPLPHLVF
ncbi:MAG: hypothetical protein MK135_13065 [Polyangiaceae bacterium]|nr:hypothetical protein [Polyangiaceae bacterium]